jgi:hypothetical protein
MVARSPHEHAKHAGKVVAVAIGGPTEPRRARDPCHYLFELLQEQVRRGQAVRLPPAVNRGHVLGYARVKSDLHGARSLRAQASEDFGSGYELSAVGAREASFQLLALLGSEVPRFLGHRLELDFSPFR